MKLIFRLSGIIKALFSAGNKLVGRKTKALEQNTFQITEEIKFDEYGNPDFTYK